MYLIHCLTLLFLYSGIECQISSNDIKLEILDMEGWDILDNVSYGTQPTLRSKLKELLELECKAPFPIKWNITGHITYPEFVKIQPYKRSLDIHNNSVMTFTLQLVIYFTATEPNVASSAKVACQSVGNPEQSKSFAVFVPGPKSFVHSGQVLNVTDGYVVPCQITDPILPVKLLQDSQPVARLKYQYDPLVGFISKDIIEGFFTCVSNNGTMEDTVFVRAMRTETSLPQGFNYFPRMRYVKSFTTDPILLSCSSTLQNIGVDIKSTEIGNGTLVEMLNSNFTSKSMKATSSVKGISKFVCSDQSGATIWSWDVEFVESPELYLDNFEGEVDCLSDYDDRSVSTVRCLNPSHCEYMKHCFQNPKLCNYKKQKQFYSDVAGRCWVQKRKDGAFCALVPYSHLNGIVQCKVRGLTKHFMFFVSLEFLRHDSWEGLPPSELIQMDEIEPVLYTNDSATFFCRAVAFLFADDLKFSIQFENGTRQFLNQSSYTIPYSENPRKVDEFNVIAELNIHLPIEAVAIRCNAPWWNSTDFYQTEKKFVTKHLLHPKIAKPRETKVKLSIGESGHNQRLNCSAVGEPRPTYTWFKDGQKLEEILVKLHIQMTKGSQDESLLEFLEVDEGTKGDYLCMADNRVGSDSLTYTIDEILEFTDNGSSGAFGAILGTTLFVLVVVLVLLAYVVNRYRKTQELIRSLTENEIEEFFKGRPELLSSNHGQRAEHLDLLPYDEEYEVDINNVEFDSSEVLGTGEFSVVVKGKMTLRSKKTDVAVKIAKPSADVTLFKTLLSEVKIMIFIGKHDNIVSLCGVCTRNIRNRNIHIVLELCENGSLEKWLRKHRRNFISLIDQSQKLNGSLKRNKFDDNQLTTFDLINWSAQIAKGMEYLTFKGIVHADLAARNVLLNAKGVAKISDFGLSKKLYECTNYVKKTKSPLPWRWMAPESLNTLTFSKESDIWSYGVTLWEIFSLGDIPFPNESWDKEFINRLATGMRMGKPKYGTMDIYSKMVLCWDNDTTIRPAFSSLRQYFAGLLDEHDDPELKGANDYMGSGTNLTMLTDSAQDDDTISMQSPEGLYANMNPDGMPMYSNFDPTGAPTYTNIP